MHTWVYTLVLVMFLRKLLTNVCLNRAYPLEKYPAKCRDAAAIMHMIMNNLDPKVAQFPHELVTYGGNGQVFSNWAQVRCRVVFSRQVAPKTIYFCSFC